ncbi:hypothetical protein L6452_36814 [Arctium lappa]|uniref:Uncharacterized protein n=1 Tax=Arctium lappa TaxID=4217 RepID=A0ACB8Y2R1_ARCLA|nr:hypothetical protein L6452_36814 [Arctium lappa]
MRLDSEKNCVDGREVVVCITKGEPIYIPRELTLSDKEEDKSESNDEDDDEQWIDLFEEEDDPKFVEDSFANKESCSKTSKASQGGTSPAEVSPENFPAVDRLSKKVMGQSDSHEGIKESANYEIDNTEVLEHGVGEKISPNNRDISSGPMVKSQILETHNQHRKSKVISLSSMRSKKVAHQKKKGSAIIGKMEELLRDKEEEIMFPNDSDIIRCSSRIKRRVIDSPNPVAISEIDLDLEFQKTIESINALTITVDVAFIVVTLVDV